MTPLKVCFNGVEFDPLVELPERVHQGLIPSHWSRYRFPSQASLFQINCWLIEHIEGRWAIYAYFRNNCRRITIAFESDADGALFVLSDGAEQCRAIDQTGILS